MYTTKITDDYPFHTLSDEIYEEIVTLINTKTNSNNWQSIRHIINQFERAYGRIDEIVRANVLRRMKKSLERVLEG